MRRDRIRRVGLAASLVAAALAVASCPSPRRDRITLGIVRLPALGLVFIADARGFFTAHGVEVVQRHFSSGRDALAALAAGEVDAAIALETPVALRVSRTHDLAILTTLHVANRNTRLVARGDRGIARPADLAEKRIGVPLGTSAEYFLHTLLAYAGVPDGQVRIVDVAPEAAVDAVASGEVDAIAIWPPHSIRAQRALGSNAMELEAEVYTEISMLVAGESVVAKRFETLVRLVRGLADAERLARDAPEEALAALRAEFPELTEAELRDAWGRVRPSLGLTHLLATVLEDEAEWLADSGRLDGQPLDVGAAIQPDVLIEVDPEAVTFVSPPRAPRPR